MFQNIFLLVLFEKLLLKIKNKNIMQFKWLNHLDHP